MFIKHPFVLYFIQSYEQGGMLILEPQPWDSYSKNHKVSEVQVLAVWLMLKKYTCHLKLFL